MKALKWLKLSGLTIETEAFTTTHQDQALNTKYHQT